VKPGTNVRTWVGSYGVVEYRTADGWYGVREASGRLDEWRWWQVEAV
jgi:hypothetical protein